MERGQKLIQTKKLLIELFPSGNKFHWTKFVTQINFTTFLMGTNKTLSWKGVKRWNWGGIRVRSDSSF